MQVDRYVGSLRSDVGYFELCKNNLCRHFPLCLDRNWGSSIIGPDQTYVDKRNVLLIIFYELEIFLIAIVNILEILEYIFGGEDDGWFS